MMIDFSTTATRRPEILSKTYESFAANLTNINLRDCTLYINIDPVPNGVETKTVIETASKFFGKVIANTPPEANFPKAVKWCLSQGQNKHLFHLEDDWVLSQKVDINKLIELLSNNEKLACVNLRAYTTIKDNRICLSPGLWKSDIAKTIASRLVYDANPEQQLRAKTTINKNGDKHLPYLGLQYSATPIISDIGRAWLNCQNIHKNKGIYFTAWTTKIDHPRRVQPLVRPKTLPMAGIIHHTRMASPKRIVPMIKISPIRRPR